jgi:Prokaryotic homologs of the JAB domain
MKSDADRGSVNRTRPLPTGEVRGRYLVSGPMMDATRAALESFALEGIHDGGHEGIVYWLGRECEGCTIFLQAIVPEADHSWGRVVVSAAEVGRLQRAARRQQLGLLCQVHSHPGTDVRHSDGDDQLILLPFESMLSIVVPRFGVGFAGLGAAGVHQFQDKQWVYCSPASVADRLIVVPPMLDLRSMSR